MTARPYMLAETPWKQVSRTRYEVAVLPWGATEAHNYHLPYGTDTMQCGEIAARSARIAWDAGARVIVLPALPFGVQSMQLDIPLCLNLNPSTQAAILRDLAESLAGQGIGKLVILNGHGGNEFKAIIRELQPRVDIFLCVVDWYRASDLASFFDEPGDHAGEMETSMMMHIAPDLVLPLEEAGPGRERRSRVAALRDGWAWAPRPWTRISEDTGVGDPAASTAEKGARFVTAISERFGRFLVELALLDLEDAYQEG
jgi:creatinine amidohydrolase